MRHAVRLAEGMGNSQSRRHIVAILIWRIEEVALKTALHMQGKITWEVEVAVGWAAFAHREEGALI